MTININISYIYTYVRHFLDTPPAAVILAARVVAHPSPPASPNGGPGAEPYPGWRPRLADLRYGLPIRAGALYG